MKRPTDFPTGAAAPAGGEALPPEPATEPAAAPVDLPKALSEREREYVGHHALAAGQRALALIDALTATMAEQAAQLVTGGQRIAELEADLQRTRTSWKVAQQFNTNFLTQRAELKQKLAAANALIARARDGFDWQQYDSPEQNQIGRDLDAHLAGQPAAPEKKPHRRECTAEWCDIGCEAAQQLAAEVRQRVAESNVEAKRQFAALSDQPAAPGRTADEQAVLDAWGAVPEHALRSATGYGTIGETCRAELARRGLK